MATIYELCWKRAAQQSKTIKTTYKVQLILKFSKFESDPQLVIKSVYVDLLTLL